MASQGLYGLSGVKPSNLRSLSHSTVVIANRLSLDFILFYLHRRHQPHATSDSSTKSSTSSAIRDRFYKFGALFLQLLTNLRHSSLLQRSSFLVRKPRARDRSVNLISIRSPTVQHIIAAFSKCLRDRSWGARTSYVCMRNTPTLRPDSGSL